jgi:hypothetical protein
LVAFPPIAPTISRWIDKEVSSVSSSAANKPAANASGGYAVARPNGKCALTGRDIVPGEKFMTALRETPAGFERLDVSLDAWPSVDRADLLAFWQSTMPQPSAKKQLFVDDAVLCELFERLADVQEPAKVNFRFVLGLILMRKRLVGYDSTRRDDAGGEWWVVKLKGRPDPLEMFNPHLDESQMQDVSGQLAEVLNESL